MCVGSIAGCTCSLSFGMYFVSSVWSLVCPVFFTSSIRGCFSPCATRGWLSSGPVTLVLLGFSVGSFAFFESVTSIPYRTLCTDAFRCGMSLGVALCPYSTGWLPATPIPTGASTGMCFKFTPGSATMSCVGFGDLILRPVCLQLLVFVSCALLLSVAVSLSLTFLLVLLWLTLQ